MKNGRGRNMDQTLDIEPLLEVKIPQDECCNQKITTSKFGLDYPDPDSFVSCQWRRPCAVYVIYRVSAALYFLAWMITAWIVFWPDGGITNLRFFTEWNFDMLTLTLIIRAVLASIAYLRQKNGETPAFSKMTGLFKLTWVCYNMTACASLCLSIIYWTLIFRNVSESNATTIDIVLDIQRHVGQATFVVVDIFITALPLRLGHFFHTNIYATTFILFSLAYSFIFPEKPPIYKFMDWNGNFFWALGITAGLSLVLAPLCWLFLYKLSTCRSSICKCRRKIAEPGLADDIESELDSPDESS